MLHSKRSVDITTCQGWGKQRGETAIQAFLAQTPCFILIHTYSCVILTHLISYLTPFFVNSLINVFLFLFIVNYEMYYIELPLHTFWNKLLFPAYAATFLLSDLVL